MRSAIVLILKTFLGGVIGALIFLSLGSIKGILDALREFSTDMPGNPLVIFLVPIFLLFCILLGAWYASWLGGDLILIASFIGLEIAFLMSSKKLVFSRFSKQTARKILGIAFLAMVVVTALCINLKLQRINKIKTTFANFCASVHTRDYPSAYRYFSPEYRSKTNLAQFIEDEMWADSIYVGVCDAKFVSSFGNTASIYPFEYTVSTFTGFPAGPELIMKSINGEWYLTGKINWYVD